MIKDFKQIKDAFHYLLEYISKQTMTGEDFYLLTHRTNIIKEAIQELKELKETIQEPEILKFTIDIDDTDAKEKIKQLIAEKNELQSDLDYLHDVFKAIADTQAKLFPKETEKLKRIFKKQDD